MSWDRNLCSILQPTNTRPASSRAAHPTAVRPIILARCRTIHAERLNSEYRPRSSSATLMLARPQLFVLHKPSGGPGPAPRPNQRLTTGYRLTVRQPEPNQAAGPLG